MQGRLATGGSVSRETVQPTAAGFAPIPQPRAGPSTNAADYLWDRAAQGLQNFAGMPGTMQRMAQGAMQTGLETVGASPEFSQAMGQAPILPIPRGAPTPQGIQSMMEQAGLDPMTGAQPGGLGTEVVGDIVEGATSFPFAPVASGVAGMTGGASRRGAEALGLGPTGQAVAEGLGGLAGGLGASAAQRGLQQIASRPPTPTIDTLRRAKDAAYKAADNAGVVVKADRFRRAVADIGLEAKKQGLDKTVTPKASGAMRRLLSEADEGRDLSLTEIDTLRKVIRRAAATPDSGDKAVALTMRNELDNFLDDLKVKDLVSGDAAAVKTLKNARALNTRVSKGQQIDDMLESARERAPQFSGSGLENALRTEFRTLARNPKRLNLFTPAEQEAIRAVNRGAPMANFFRMIGKLAPTGVVSGGIGAAGGAGIGSALAGPPGAAVGALAVPVVGAGARGAATGLTSQAANEVRNMMLRGFSSSTLPSSIPAGSAAGLLAGQPSLLDLEDPARIRQPRGSIPR